MSRGLFRIAMFIVVIAIISLAVSCQGYNNDRGIGDAGIGKKLEEKREVIVMPDRFANVAMACDGHGHRVYATTREAPVVVIEDASCKGGR